MSSDLGPVADLLPTEYIGLPARVARVAVVLALLPALLVVFAVAGIGLTAIGAARLVRPKTSRTIPAPHVRATPQRARMSL